MVATDVGLTDQVPPVVASVSVTEYPWQTVEEPAIAAGNGFTVTTADEEQPAGDV